MGAFEEYTGRRWMNRGRKMLVATDKKELYVPIHPFSSVVSLPPFNNTCIFLICCLIWHIPLHLGLFLSLRLLLLPSSFCHSTLLYSSTFLYPFFSSKKSWRYSQFRSRGFKWESGVCVILCCAWKADVNLRINNKLCASVDFVEVEFSFGFVERKMITSSSITPNTS